MAPAALAPPLTAAPPPLPSPPLPPPPPSRDHDTSEADRAGDEPRSGAEELAAKALAADHSRCTNDRGRKPAIRREARRNGCGRRSVAVDPLPVISAHVVAAEWRTAGGERPDRRRALLLPADQRETSKSLPRDRAAVDPLRRVMPLRFRRQALPAQVA